MPEQELICIGCPLGCHVTLKISDKRRDREFDREPMQGRKGICYR